MLKIGLIILILGGALGAFIFFNSNSGKQKIETVHPSPQNDISNNPDEPPLKLKSIGVEFSDFKFTKQKLQFNRIFMGFGFVIPGNMSSTQKDKFNPQPTFIVPLGTPVRSIVDGTVAATPKLWSGDYSIQVTADGKMQKWIYETEHLINPKVKVGDKVVAGQIIGEVSNFNDGAPAGFGSVEIGILKGGEHAQHVCPFIYLDDSIKMETLTKIKNLFKTWQDYIGDQSLYPETKIPGCLTLEAQKENSQTAQTTTSTSQSKTNPYLGVSCTSNPNPKFSHDFTDFNLIAKITPPSLIASKLQDRAFLWIDASKTTKVPIYAPVDTDLVRGIYKAKINDGKETIDYDLHFQVSCEVWFFINHISDPIDKIKKFFPKTPATSSTSDNLTHISPLIHFKAGELIGYTKGTAQAHNFDFAVFDLNRTNKLVGDLKSKTDDTRFYNFICPFDVFPENIKNSYYQKLIPDLIPESNCK